jgi:ribosome-associated protein
VDGDVRVSPQLTIPAEELIWRFTTSGGPGGQHANRSATRVEVRFDIAGSPSLTDTQRARLLDALGPELRVTSDESRSQSRNRAVALDRLRSRLGAALRPKRSRHPTKPTRASVQRRLEAKRRRSEVKRSRRPPDD